jgi:hypothetical protein
MRENMKITHDPSICPRGDQQVNALGRVIRIWLEQRIRLKLFHDQASKGTGPVRAVASFKLLKYHLKRRMGHAIEISTLER